MSSPLKDTIKKQHLSLILRMANQGLSLARYLAKAHYAPGNTEIQGRVESIIDLHREALSLQPAAAKPKPPTFKGKPLADIHVHLEKGGGHTVEPSTAFDIVEDRDFSS